MSNVTRRALRVYAALDELKGGQGDVLDALIPFFEPVLAVLNKKIFDPKIFASGVRLLYKWRFTTDIAAQFIPRLTARGYLEKMSGNQQDRIYIVRFENQQDDSEPEQIGAVVEKIIDEFEKFPPRVTDLISYKKNRNELKDILVRFLVSMDATGQGAYEPQLGALELGGDAQALLDEMEEGGVPLDANDRYMCARFVQYLFDRKPEYSRHLARLASIALLTEVVEDFLRPTSASDKSDLNIVLDAPLALDLLGCSGHALCEDIKTIVEALRKIGCNFIVFPINCREMQRNLRSMLSLPPTDRHGYTHHAMVKGEVTFDFVAAVANNPERALQNIDITVRPLELESLPSSHRHFARDKYEDFFSSIMWVNDVLPREHDATCAALVMRLREGRKDSDLFKTKFVLATRNSRFVRHSRNYCLQSRLIFENQEGPAIDHRELATAAWLRTGLGAEDDVPKGHLIATCDRVLKARPEVRRALAVQIQRLTPERLQQLNVLMLDSRSVQKLSDVTLNDERLITADNAEHLLETIRLATAEEQEQKHLKQLNEERTHFARQYEQSMAELDNIRNELDAIRNTEFIRKIRQRSAAEAAATQCNQGAMYFEYAVTLVLVLLCIVGVINYFLKFLDHSQIWLILSLAFVLFGVYRGISALLERPTIGLKTILNPLVKLVFEFRLQSLGLDPGDIGDTYEVKKARVICEHENATPAASP